MIICRKSFRRVDLSVISVFSWVIYPDPLRVALGFHPPSVPFYDIHIYLKTSVITGSPQNVVGVGEKGAKYLSVTLRNMLASCPPPKIMT